MYKNFKNLLFLLLMLVISSCSIVHHTKIEERLISILNDTSVYNFPLVEIQNKQFFEVLDTIMVLRKNCAFCNNEINYPSFYSIILNKKDNRNEISIQLRTCYSLYGDLKYAGGFYYKNTLFLVEQNTLSRNYNGIFALSPCVITVQHFESLNCFDCFGCDVKISISIDQKMSIIDKECSKVIFYKI